MSKTTKFPLGKKTLLASLLVGVSIFGFTHLSNMATTVEASSESEYSIDGGGGSWFYLDGIAYYVDIPPNHVGHTPVYRFQNTVAGGHFYTASESEKDSVIANYSSTFSYEGIAFYVDIPPNHSGLTPVYRFQNLVSGGHFYTASESEKDNVIANYYMTYSYDGIAYYVNIPPNHTGKTPVYRLRNLWAGGQFYTASEDEKNTLTGG